MGQVELNVVVQQPQFLPWAGLWFKVVSADVYVLYAGVKFDQADHQHRVTVGGSWVTLPVEGNQRNALIKDVRLADNFKPGLLKIARTIRQQVMKKGFPYRDRLEPIVARLESWDDPSMLALNNALFLDMANLLGIKTEIRVDTTLRHGTAIENLDACLAEHVGDRPFRYMCGGQGLQYIGYDSLKTPIETRFQLMQPEVSPDSILHLIASLATPLDEIKKCARWRTREGSELGWKS